MSEYDPSKPYRTGDPYDAWMMSRVKNLMRLRGTEGVYSDVEIMKALRAVQDANVLLGVAAVDPVDALVGILFGILY